MADGARDRTAGDSPKFIVSTTLSTAERKNSTEISGNVAEQLRALKRQPGKNIAILRSVTLVMALRFKTWSMNYSSELVDARLQLAWREATGNGQRLFLLQHGTPLQPYRDALSWRGQ